MKKRTNVKYTNERIGDIKVTMDFLPSPDELVMKEETVKVTLSLSKVSVDYFKELAEKKHTHYQKMIRILLDKYASHYHR
jgi:predicted DNA binding CopG/RHH family protein